MSMSKKKTEALAAEVKTLRKKNGNLTCADCPMRNTTYVNTTHSTFVCTDCSGILRKYAFRVKSIHAASFRAEEVDALREAGNKTVNGIYLAKFKKGKGYELPKLGETKKLDEFIKMKYVDKRWFSESSSKKSKKKKAKKKVETPPESSSDSDSSSDSESSSEEPVVVQKKSKKNKGKDKRSKKSKKAPTAAPEPVDLFDTSPPTQQAANNDDWANFDDDDWDAFGTSAAPSQPVQTQQNNFFNTPAAAPQQQSWQQPQQPTMQPTAPPQQSKAHSGISPNDPFFAAFQPKQQTQSPTQGVSVAAAKANDPFAELMASSAQTSSSTPEKVSVSNGPSNPFGAPAATQNSGNPFRSVQSGGWGAPPTGGFGAQQGYGYPSQNQQQAYGYPPQNQQQFGYANQQQFQSPPQQQMMGYPQQQQYNMQQNFANMNLQSGAPQPGGGSNPWA